MAVRFDEKAQYSKTDFLTTFQQIRNLTFTANTVKSAFKKTGLIPYFPSIVTDKIRAEVYAKKKRQSTAEMTSKLSQEELLQRTPQGLTADAFLKHYAAYDRYITERLNKDPDLVNIKNAFARLFKGVTAKVHVSELLKNKIAAQTSAITARKERNKNNRRINHIDALTVDKARSKIQARSQAEKLQEKASKERKKIKDFKA